MVRSIEKDALPTWFPIDSRYGRYMFGAVGAPNAEGFIDAGMTCTMDTLAHTPFEGERLFVHSAYASDFLIRNVFIAPQRAFMSVNSDPLLAEPFAVKFDELPDLKLSVEEAAQLHDGVRMIVIKVDRKVIDLLGGPFVTPRLLPGWRLTGEVENISAKPSRFLAALLGKGWF